MLTKIAGFVLAGSLTTLAVGGLAGARSDEWRHERRIERRIRHNIERNIEQNIERSVRRAHDVGNLPGTYAFEAEGYALGKFPWAAHVELSLRENGRYELRVRTNIDGETETETSWGRYRFKGDRVLLYSPHDDDVHELVIEGDRLQFNTGLKEKLALKAVGIEDAAFKKIVN